MRKHNGAGTKTLSSVAVAAIAKSIKMKTDNNASPDSLRELRPKFDETDDPLRKVAFVHQRA